MMGGKETFHRAASARARLTHQESFLFQPFNRYLADLAKRMIRRSNNYQRVFHKRFTDDIPVLRGLPHDCEISQIIAQMLKHGFAIGNIETYGNTAITLAEFCKEMRCEIIGGADYR